MDFNYTTDERFAITAAGTAALTPAESRELLHFLGYPESLPNGTAARMHAVMEKIMANRMVAVLDVIKPAMYGVSDAGYDEGWYVGRADLAEKVMKTLPKVGA